MHVCLYWNAMSAQIVTVFQAVQEEGHQRKDIRITTVQ